MKTFALFLAFSTMAMVGCAATPSDAAPSDDSSDPTSVEQTVKAESSPRSAAADDRSTGGERSANPQGFYLCGWDPDAPSGRAYYRHCDNGDGSWIWIRVEGYGRGWDQCVGPGRTYLGSTQDVKYAWYKGATC